MKIFFYILGFLSLILGGVGLIIPVWPTTPFIILAALCFARSDERIYNFLLKSKLFGEFIKDYKENTGVSKKIKLRASIFLWTGIIISIIVVKKPLLKIMLFFIGLFVNFYIIKLKTKE